MDSRKTKNDAESINRETNGMKKLNRLSNWKKKEIMTIGISVPDYQVNCHDVNDLDSWADLGSSWDMLGRYECINATGKEPKIVLFR